MGNKLFCAYCSFLKLLCLTVLHSSVPNHDLAGLIVGDWSLESESYNVLLPDILYWHTEWKVCCWFKKRWYWIWIQGTNVLFNWELDDWSSGTAHDNKSLSSTLLQPKDIFGRSSPQGTFFAPEDLVKLLRSIGRNEPARFPLVEVFRKLSFRKSLLHLQPGMKLRFNVIKICKI